MGCERPASLRAEARNTTRADLCRSRLLVGVEQTEIKVLTESLLFVSPISSILLRSFVRCRNSQLLLALTLVRSLRSLRSLTVMTFFPRNVPTNVIIRRHGLLLPTRPKGPPALFIEGYRPDKVVDPEVLRGIELLKEIDTLVSLYDDNGVPLMRNPWAVRYLGTVPTTDDSEEVPAAIGATSAAGGAAGPSSASTYSGIRPSPQPLQPPNLGSPVALAPGISQPALSASNNNVTRTPSGISAVSSTGSAAAPTVYEPVIGDRFLDPQDRADMWALLSAAKTGSFVPRSATPESGGGGGEAGGQQADGQQDSSSSQQQQHPQASGSGINRAVFRRDVHCATLLGPRWLSWQCKRYVDPATGKIGFLVSAKDVTEKYLAEKALVRAREEAEAANRSKSSFLANMSHELRTPLTGIFSVLDILRTLNLTAEQESCVDTLHSSSKVLLTLLNDILDLSKIEAGQLHLERIPFDLHGLLGDVRDLFAAQMASKGLSFDVSVSENLPVWVRGDPTRTRQVLYNVVGNAGKFTELGRVSVTATCRRGVGGDDDPDNGIVEFRISDTGIGIPEDKINQLFQPFVQADVSTTRKFGGTGLGLAIVSNICQIWGHGSSIQVQSQQGVGSVFIIRLWLPEVGGEGPPSALIGAAAGGGGGGGAAARAENARQRTLAETVMGIMDGGFARDEATNGHVVGGLNGAAASAEGFEDRGESWRTTDSFAASLPPESTPLVSESDELRSATVQEITLSILSSASGDRNNGGEAAVATTNSDFIPAVGDGSAFNGSGQFSEDGYGSSELSSPVTGISTAVEHRAGSPHLLSPTTTSHRSETLTALNRKSSYPKRPIPKTVVPSRILLAEDNKVFARGRYSLAGVRLTCFPSCRRSSFQVNQVGRARERRSRNRSRPIAGVRLTCFASRRRSSFSPSDRR